MAFNKLFIMIPVMLAARKLDEEDPQTIYILRIVYGSVHTIILLIVAYTYIQSVKASKGHGDKVMYVPPTPMPFADPNAKKKYVEAVFDAYVVSQARQLLASTLFGLVVTVALHYYRGMTVGLAIQAVMGPVNIAENALVKALLLGDGLKPESKIFDEKTADELTEDDEVVDGKGNPVQREIGPAPAVKDASKSFEDILLDTWDEGAKANLGPLMEAINSSNCNYEVAESGWTPLMVLSGIGVKGSASAIRQAIEYGGDPAKTDLEGWNAMHWAAFHGSLEGTKALRGDYSHLVSVKDKEGKTPLTHARAEGNDDVAALLEEIEIEATKGNGAADVTTDDSRPDEGLRKRK